MAISATFVLLQNGVYGLLTENGSCMNGKVQLGNSSYIINQSYADFIKNLTKDNRPMAEVMCQSMVNQNISK